MVGEYELSKKIKEKPLARKAIKYLHKKRICKKLVEIIMEDIEQLQSVDFSFYRILELKSIPHLEMIMVQNYLNGKQKKWVINFYPCPHCDCLTEPLK